MRDDRPVLLSRRQRAHQRQSAAFLILEQAGACKWPGIGVVGLGAEKAGCEHHLPADDEAVEAEMVSEQLPPPRLRFRRGAKETKDVSPFTEHLSPGDQVAEK